MGSRHPAALGYVCESVGPDRLNTTLIFLSMSAMPNSRPVLKNVFTLSTLVLLLLLISSMPAFGHLPSPQSELSSAPAANAGSSNSQQSNTSHDGADQATSVGSGKETLTKQADYFVPRTNRERWNNYAYSLVEPQAFLYPAAQSGLNQARNKPHEWTQGAEAYGERFSSAYGQHAIGSTLSNTLAFELHEDNRYFKSRKKGIGRLSYAITSALLGRHDDGSRSISLSAIGGGAAGAFISRTWQPRSANSAGDGAVSFGYAIAARAGANLVREFLPRRLERILK